MLVFLAKPIFHFQMKNTGNNFGEKVLDICLGQHRKCLAEEYRLRKYASIHLVNILYFSMPLILA